MNFELFQVLEFLLAIAEIFPLRFGERPRVLGSSERSGPKPGLGPVFFGRPKARLLVKGPSRSRPGARLFDYYTRPIKGGPEPGIHRRAQAQPITIPKQTYENNV